jgi:hypothetical protein
MVASSWAAMGKGNMRGGFEDVLGHHGTGSRWREHCEKGNSIQQTVNTALFQKLNICRSIQAHVYDT